MGSCALWTYLIKNIVITLSSILTVYLQIFNAVLFAVTLNSCLASLIVAYIRPLLDYASPLWSLNSVELINRLEGVQSMYTKRIPSIAHLSYNDRLTYLGLQRLEARRLCFDLLFLSKLKFDLTHLTLADFSINTSRLRTNRFISPIYSSFVDFNSFVSRTIRLWNALNKNVTNAIHYLHYYLIRRLLFLINFTTYLQGRT